MTYLYLFRSYNAFILIYAKLMAYHWQGLWEGVQKLHRVREYENTGLHMLCFNALKSKITSVSQYPV